MEPIIFAALLRDTMARRFPQPGGRPDFDRADRALRAGVVVAAAFDRDGVDFGTIAMPSRSLDWRTCPDCNCPFVGSHAMCSRCELAKPYQSKLKCLRCHDRTVAGNGRFCVGCVLDAFAELADARAEHRTANQADVAITEFIDTKNGRMDTWIDHQDADSEYTRIEVMLLAQPLTVGQARWASNHLLWHRDDDDVLDARHPDGYLTAGDVSFWPVFDYTSMRWAVLRCERAATTTRVANTSTSIQLDANGRFAGVKTLTTTKRIARAAWTPVDALWLSAGTVNQYTDDETWTVVPEDFHHRMWEAWDCAARWREEWRRVMQDALIDGWGDEHVQTITATALGVEIDVLAERLMHQE